MQANLLHVVTVFFNPVGWTSRRRLYDDFEQHMLASGVQLTTVECALGEVPFELSNPQVNHVKVRTTSLVWNKENLLNLGIQHLPSDWKYVAWLDADIKFRAAGWASQAVHALQQYQVIQPWQTCLDLGPNGELSKETVHTSFLCQWWHRRPIGKGNYEFPHPGYAWCATRAALNSVGGLLETAALGAGDLELTRFRGRCWG